MYKLFTGIAFMLSFHGTALSQYYYKDIISNKQLITDMAAYRDAKVRHIIIKSFEDNGEPSEGFFCEKKISKDYRKSELFTRSNLSGTSLLESWFNDKGQLLKTYDSSAIAVNTNYYEYDGSGRILKIMSTVKSNDDDFVNEIREEHIYTYNPDMFPVKMIRIKNTTDSIVILFQPDEKNNVSIEKDTRTGTKYYYYYDSQNRLTDVVHANEFRENLVADYLFEYNNAGQITQMTTTEEGGNNYFIWKYNYDNNLRSQERLFSKDRRLMGRIEYEYK